MSEQETGSWLVRIQAEYREMPGLRLTEPQMQRLWGLDQATCAALLRTLVTHHILVRTPQGAYIRADAGASGR